MAQMAPQILDHLLKVFAELESGHRDEAVLSGCKRVVDDHIRSLLAGVRFQKPYFWQLSELNDIDTGLLAFREYAGREWLKRQSGSRLQNEPFLGWLGTICNNAKTDSHLGGIIGNWVRTFIQRTVETKNIGHVSSVYKNISGRLRRGLYASGLDPEHGRVFGMKSWMENKRRGLSRGVASQGEVQHALLQLESGIPRLPDGRIKRGTVNTAMNTFFTILDKFASKDDFLLPLVMTITGVRSDASLKSLDESREDGGHGSLLNEIPSASVGFMIQEDDLIELFQRSRRGRFIS